MNPSSPGLGQWGGGGGEASRSGGPSGPGGPPNLPERGGGGGPSSSSGGGPSNPQQNESANPSDFYSGAGFTYQNGVYTVEDPTNVARHGYINQSTGRPHERSFEPFCINLSNAMNHSYFTKRPRESKISRKALDPNSAHFLEDFVYNTNQRMPNSGVLPNTVKVRDDLLDIDYRSDRDS